MFMGANLLYGCSSCFLAVALQTSQLLPVYTRFDFPAANRIGVMTTVVDAMGVYSTLAKQMAQL